MTTVHPDSPRGWLVVGAASLSMFAVFGVAYSFGAFFTSMSEEFGSSTSETAFVFSLTIGLSFFLSPLTGRWADRVGPRPVVASGAVSLVVGLLLTTLVDSLVLGYLTYGVGVGFAIACGYVPMVATVGGWFVQKRAMAIGFAVAGIGVGTLVGSPLAARLIDATSWRTTYVLFAIGGGACMLLASLAAERGPVAVMAPKARPIRELFRLRTFSVLYASTVCVGFGVFIPFVFLVRSAEDRGIDNVAAALLVGLIGGASVIGRLGLGTLADRFGALRLEVGAFVLLAGSHLIWLFAGRNYALLVIYAITLGIGYGGFIALSPAVIADIFGLDGLGGMIGMQYTAAGLSALIAPPLAGWLVDLRGDRAAILLAFVMSSIATLVLASVRQQLAQPNMRDSPV